MILVDTSIWIDHFRRGDADLVRIIEDDRLLCHPAVIGELALGSLHDRIQVLKYLQDQREAMGASHAQVLAVIDRHGLHGMGIGYTDAHLLASVLLEEHAALWTRDRRLNAAAEKAGAARHNPASMTN